MALSPEDPCSFSLPKSCVVTHLHLDLSVDFDRKILQGSAVLSVEKKNDDTSVLVRSPDVDIARMALWVIIGKMTFLSADSEQ